MGSLVVLPIAAAIAIQFHKKIEETIAPAMMAVVIVLYLSGIVTTFRPGLYICFALSIICAGFVIYHLIRHRTYARLLTAGLLAFLGYLVIFIVLNHHRHLVYGIDFAHYGLSLRDAFRLHDFSNAADSADLLPLIAPGSVLWGYFSSSVYGSYSESHALMSQGMIQAAFTLPFFSMIKSASDWKKGVVLWTVLFLIPIIASEKYAYATLSPAFLIGFATAYLVQLYRLHQKYTDRYSLAMLSLTALFLSITGIGGPVIVCMILLMFISFFFLRQRQGVNSVPVHRELIALSSMAGALLVGIISWQLYLALSGRINNETVESMLTESLSGVNGDKQPLRLFLLFLQGLSTRSFAGTIGHLLPVSVFSFLLIILLGFVIYTRIIRKRFDLPDADPFFSVSVALGSVLYLIVVFILYLIMVPAARAFELAYLDLALIPLTVFLLVHLFIRMLTLFATAKKTRDVFWITSLWICLLSVNLGSVFLLFTEQPAPAEYPALDIAYERGFQFFPGDKIFYISHHDQRMPENTRPLIEASETEIASLYYTLTENNQVQINLTGQDLCHWEDGMRLQDSVSEVYQTIREGGYQYAYVGGRGSRFDRGYAALFMDATARDEGVFFGVDTYDDGTVQLLTISKDSVE